MLTLATEQPDRALRIIPLTMVALVAAMAALLTTAARAEETTPLVLLLEPQTADDYSYRQVNHQKTIDVMLYGFKDPSPSTDSVIPKDKKALSAFFSDHWKRVREDYLGGEHAPLQFVAGGDSFTAPVNRGIGMEPAKMVGLTVPVGKFTVGGGYNWGEKNPAYMLRATDGFMVGAGYDTGRTGFQVSYTTAGQKVMGFEVGGTDIRYNNLLIGTSFRVNDKIGITATAQYRSDTDPLTTGTTQAVFTVGTKWKF